MRYRLLGICLIAATTAAANPAAEPPFEVASYIAEMDRTMMPEKCSAYVVIRDKTENRPEELSEGMIIRKENKVVFVQTEPQSKRNLALLRLRDDFYARLPNTGKVIRTGATQNNRGGETDNLDLTRFNTLEDYVVTYLGVEQKDGKSCYRFDLTAKNRKLAYSKARLWVDRQTDLPYRKEFLAVSGKILKRLAYRSIELRDGQLQRAELEFVDDLMPENRSLLSVRDVTAKSSIPDQFFTREYLERGRLYPKHF